MSSRVFKDRETVDFYRIVIGIPVVSSALGPLTGEWISTAIPLLGALGFAYFGPPLSAEILAKDSILFKGIIRRTKVSKSSLKRVSAVGIHDYRAHIILRNKYGIPIMYRNRKYANAPVLAKAVLRLIEKSPDVKVTADAMNLLRRTAKGNTKPIPLVKS